MPSAAMSSTDTLRDLILDGYEISIHCRAYPCANRAARSISPPSPRDEPSLGRGACSSGFRPIFVVSPKPRYRFHQFFGQNR
jgi:hypothetical protein